ncbi:FecR family protein [Parabacteroides pacaensis]|uniref:FecR family protein n=1 Tax=Parabacteroides pacaensis TaxID=2086575 RepID=UPI000D0E34DF|nr:FecR domain-containing protein [Parabacteroides pacaensis]
MEPEKTPIETLIANYLSGRSTPREREELITWIRADSSHRAYYMQLKNLWEISHPAFSPSEIDLNKAHRTVMQKIFPLQPHRKSIYRYWQQIAAILFFPLLIFTVSFYTYRPLSAEKVLDQEVISPYGVRSLITLPDSSKVWLNAGSKLKYPQRFISKTREVYLQGEAYFEVKSDKSNPFVVHSGKVRVKATGTAFNVEAYITDSITAVTMEKGTIEINIGSSKPMSLMPGERLNFNHNTSKYLIQKTDPYKWCAWKDGNLVFRDDPLEYVFKRIGQMFNVSIQVKDPEIAKHPYRATFEGESLDEILRLLKMTAPIYYKNLERTQTIDHRYIKPVIEVYKAR